MPSDSIITLGESLIGELGRRAQRGMYFNYKQYGSLRAVDSVDEMQAFLDSAGFASVLATADPKWLADGLAEAAEDRIPPWWATVDVIELVAMPIWLLSRLPPKRRVFPRKTSSP